MTENLPQRLAALPCPVCNGTLENRDAMQAWDISGAPVPECRVCLDESGQPTGRRFPTLSEPCPLIRFHETMASGAGEPIWPRECIKCHGTGRVAREATEGMLMDAMVSLGCSYINFTTRTVQGCREWLVECFNERWPLVEGDVEGEGTSRTAALLAALARAAGLEVEHGG